jgi:hypothetical protein
MNLESLIDVERDTHISAAIATAEEIEPPQRRVNA